MIKILGVIFLALLCAAAGSAWYCMIHISVKRYSIKLPGIHENVRAVLVSDLHNRSYGKNNQKLLNRIREQKPDVIFAVGDIMGRNAREPEIRKMLEFLADCRRVSPVVYSPGNHERGLILAGYSDLYRRIEALDIPVLNNSWMEYRLGKTVIALGGTVDYAFPNRIGEETFRQKPVYRMLTEMEQCGLPTVVLAHKPDSFGFCDASERWHIDLVLSGHTHGGVVRLPIIGGLVSPGEGLFPGYDSGYFRLNGTQMIIGGGLSGYASIPRIFNPPEICVIELE